MALHGQPGLEFGDGQVFDRYPAASRLDVHMSKIPFYMLTTLSTVMGWVVLCASAIALRGWQPGETWHYLVVVGAVLISMIAGSVIAVKSRSWKVSAFAYLGLIAAPLGILFGPFVLDVGIGNMIYALVATAAYTVLLSLIGFGISTDLERTGFGKVILATLMLYLVVSVALFRLSATNPAVMVTLAVIGIVIFSAGLVYNVNRSKFVPHTVDAAVDIGMQNFLETVNIALRMAQVVRYMRA